MFSGCSSLTELDLSGFNTSKVVNMGKMFYGCSSLTKLDLSSFSTASLIDIGQEYKNIVDLHDMQFGVGKMFAGCKSLKTIYVSDRWRFKTELPRSDYTFYECKKLVGGNGTGYDQFETHYQYARVDTAEAPGYFTYKAAEKPLITGDFDADDCISVEDAQGVLNVYTALCADNPVSLTAAQKTASDVNSDGSIDCADAQIILLYYVSNTLCGQNVTWDELLG